MIHSVRSGWCLALVATAGIAALAPPAAAQGTPSTVVQTSASADAPAGGAVLDRTIGVRLEQVTLGDALQAIAAKAAVQLSYSRAQAPLTMLVSLVAERITVGDALRMVLEGTNLQVIPLSPNRVALAPREGTGQRAAVVLRQASGLLTGRVTDSRTGRPIGDATVVVETTNSRAATDAAGRYTIRGVRTGRFDVAVRALGYTPSVKPVDVLADSAVHLEFVLTSSVTKLDEVVTTALGDQRRYEVGTVISTIHADSVTPTAPITDLTDLISARAPGVEVIENSGLTGSGEAIRIRGQNSIALQGDPIIIVDGIRQDNSPGGNSGLNSAAGGSSQPSPTRLNDIDFADVASIDVLKGPSASTEYGTDAANGVIVITTKRGGAGRPQWRVSAEETRAALPVTFPDGYYAWGHTTDVARTPVNCPLVPDIYVSGYGSTAGSCAVDSVTRWNPLNHSYYSLFGTGARAKYDLSVSGGSDALRYFVSGGLSNETGILHTPGVFHQPARALGFPESALKPNGEDQRSIRANTVIRLAPTADLTVTSAYLSTSQTTPDAGNLYAGIYTFPALRDSAHFYGYGLASETPLGGFGRNARQSTSRLTGGLTGNWRPVTWLVAHGTVGVDHGSQRTQTLQLPQAFVYFAGPAFANQGAAGIGNATTDVYSVDLRTSATAMLSAAARAVTSIGLQLADTRSQGVTVSGSGLTATNLTLNGVVAPTVVQQGVRQATLGGYGEEQVSFLDRLFVTGAIRVDAGSAFGRQYHTTVYPKASVSWLALNGGATTLRLRGAFGTSGVQPLTGAALQLYAPAVAWLNGGYVTVDQLNAPGNPVLKPERSAEFEGGADVGLWAGRASVEVTGYSKTTTDALVNTSTGWDLGSYPYEENIGEVRNTGVEGTVTATVLRSRPLNWDVSLNASISHNTLVHLAPGVPSQVLIGASAQLRQAPGYPLYGYWGLPVRYADANHDGIIEPGEVTAGDSTTFVGPSLPTRQASVTTHVGLLGDALTVGALVDYRGGFRLANTTAYYAALFGQNQREQNDATAPLWLQARSVASIVGPCCTEPRAFYEDGAYLRFRELSLTYALPRRMTRVARVASLSLTAAARNLALWTRYTGVDPETSNSIGFNAQQQFTSNTSIVNNDIRESYSVVPLARYWVLRVNVGLQ